MKQNLFKYMMRRAGGIFLLAAACMGAFSSCSDDDDTLNGKLDKTNAEVLSQSVSSLSFTWKAIKNASQYAYELSDPDKNLVESGVTTDLAASFTKLKPNTTYQLKVWAYGAYGSGYETSEPIYLTATTPAVVQLGMPEVKVVTSGATTTASWKSVEHAKKYEYYVKLKDSDKVLESGTLTDTEVALYGLVGEYELGVKSLSTSEAYSDSEYDKVEFKVEKREVWRTVGTFNDGAGNSWKATIVAYSNDSYTILKWYGNEGYDLEFSVTSGGNVAVTNAYKDDGSWYYVRTDATHHLTVHHTYHSSFSGNSASGKIMIYNGKDITFTWPLAVTESWRAEGSCSVQGRNWKATLVAYSDGSYKLLKWFGNDGYDLAFSVASDGKPTFLNSVKEEGGWYYVKTAENSQLGLYPAYQSTFSGDKNSGSFAFYSTYSEPFKFSWGGTTQQTVDALVGTYSHVSKGYEKLTDGYNWTQFNNTSDVTITKVDDKTIQLSGFFVGFEKMDSGVLKGTVDFSAKTITFAPQVVSRDMTFCTYKSITTPVVATFTDAGVISFKNWGLIYQNFDFVYTGAQTTLTKK
jgi:hypothetical protein